MNSTLSTRLTVLVTLISCLLSAAIYAEQTPIKHRIVADITEFAEAKKVFADTTTQIKGKTKLDAKELHEIHMITYSLEKAIAYFAENFKGEQKAAAEKMAEVVELVHLGSENNRTEETKIYLAEYLRLSEAFSKAL